MESVPETCPFKMVLSGGMGFMLGGAFGLFMSSMRYDTPMSTVPGTGMYGTPGAVSVSSLPMRQQLRHGLADMGRSSLSSAKNFGMVGAIYSFSECVLEGLRAKNDMGNSMAAGCFTGAVLARSGGPMAVGIGCAGFAAFSAAIDTYMAMPGEAKGGKID